MSYDAPAPQWFEWDGDGMRPLSPALADREFTIGERYRLGPVEERSINTHNHFFAMLREAWNNLPHEQMERFPSIEHMRKYALIKAGYCTETDFVAADPEQARKLAREFMDDDEFALVEFVGNVVRKRKAKSQSKRAMGAKQFQESKNAVLDIVSAMIGTTAAELERHTGKAA